MQDIKWKTESIFNNISYKKDILPQLLKKKQELIEECYKDTKITNEDLNIIKAIIAKNGKRSNSYEFMIANSELSNLINIITDSLDAIKHYKECYCFNIKQAQMILHCCSELGIKITINIETNSEKILHFSDYLHNKTEINNFINNNLKIDYITIKPIERKRKYVKKTKTNSAKKES